MVQPITPTSKRRRSTASTKRSPSAATATTRNPSSSLKVRSSPESTIGLRSASTTRMAAGSGSRAIPAVCPDRDAYRSRTSRGVLARLTQVHIIPLARSESVNTLSR